MWANEQALASGLSEYINFTLSCLMSSMKKKKTFMSHYYMSSLTKMQYFYIKLFWFFLSCHDQLSDGVNAPYYYLIQLNSLF